MLRSFISFVVHRRLVALSVTLAIAIYGVYAYLQTAIEAYPDVTNVQVAQSSRDRSAEPKQWPCLEDGCLSLSCQARV